MTRFTARIAVVAIVAVVAALVLIGVVATGLIGSSGGASLVPLFVDDTAGSGITHVYDGGETFFTGGGAAVFDCNGDGKPDLYVAGGTNPAALYENQSEVGGPLRFTQVHAPATDLTGVTGAYPIDIDGDGTVDLAVLRADGLSLLRGLGGCRFEPANATWHADTGTGWTTAFSATWEGDNSLPTLAIGRYLRLDAKGQPTFDCADNSLLRPAPSGSGYGTPIALAPGYCALSMLFSDWDRSGRRDLRVSNDRNYYTDGGEQLWRIAPGEAPLAYSDADGWVRLQVFGMGIATYDVTGDGYPEYFLTSQGDDKLQTLTAGPSQPTFRDIALKRGVTLAQPFTGGDVLPSTSWHPEFEDVNNDGLIDLFVSKGNVSAQPDYAQKDPSDLMLGQQDGTFAEAADKAGILDFARGRGAILADFNLDGLLDLVEVHLGAPVKIWRNVGAGDATHPAQMGHWLGVQLTQPGGNRDAIGAWIEVRTPTTTMQRELTIGGGHISGQLGWIHFGLGSAADAQVRVQWPDGETGPWLPVRADQFVVVQRGATAVQPWQPPPN